MVNKRGYRLKSIGDISHCLAKTVNELRRGEIDVTEARGRGYLLNILLTVLQESELEERLNVLENKMDEKLNIGNQNTIDFNKK